MKGMLVSLAFLLATVTAIAINAVAVDTRLEALEDALLRVPCSEDIPADTLASLMEDAYSLWLEGEPLLSLTVHRTGLTDCRHAIENALALSKSSERADFVSALLEARLRVAALRQREGLSAKNLI